MITSDFLLDGHLVDVEETDGNDVSADESDDSREPDVVYLIGVRVHELNEARHTLRNFLFINPYLLV